MPLDLPKGRNAAALADWAELLVLTTEGGTVSTARLSRLLKGEGTDAAEEEIEAAEGLNLDDDGQEDLELPLIDEGRSEREVRVEQMLDEIALRLRLGPKVYAFEASQERIAKRGSPGERVYLFLLLLSWEKAPTRVAKRLHEVEAAYDAVALEALRRYLGRNACGIRFAKNAHVPDDNATRPKKFRPAIKWLRDELDLGVGRRVAPNKERVKHWEDQRGGGGRTPLNSYEDGGVDVVVWWRFGDERAGSPVLLAQCTVQLEWGEKVADIKLDLWEKWIDFATVPPQTALVLPFAVNRASNTWDDRTVTAGVIVDRLRLLELLDELDEQTLATLLDDETCAWIDRELSAAA